MSDGYKGRRLNAQAEKAAFLRPFYLVTHDLLVEKALVLLVARALPGHKFADG